MFICLKQMQIHYLVKIIHFLNQTPQQIQENFEKNNPSTAHEISSNVTVASNDETNEAIVREILSTLKTK